MEVNTTTQLPGSADYITEKVDALPFASPEKTARYRTERYRGAMGLNWYTCDPTLQFLMRFMLDAKEQAFGVPRLTRFGELCGGPIAERAELTDKHPPHLEKYDRWGHDVSRVVIPESALATKRDLLEHSFDSPKVYEATRSAGVRIGPLWGASMYLLNQAEIGMACAIGTGGAMVATLVAKFAPDDVKMRVLPKIASGEWYGSTAQCLTERSGGSDLAQLETTATPVGDAWLLNGFKWFVSNVDGEAWVVMAKPEGAPDTGRSVCSFLVLKQRRDGTRNGIRIRQLKDKLGTMAVASAEVELVDAEAFLLSDAPREGDASGGAGDGKGLSRMMKLTNAARLGIAMMGLGCARRAMVESVSYARSRTAFGKPLIEQPLMRRKLAELIVEVEAAQALVFDSFAQAPQGTKDPLKQLRLGAPLAKLRAARLGISAASDAIEIHGGNGYIESWPMARILRDAQVNTVWEGPDNILCLDVRRAIENEGAEAPFLERLRKAVGSAEPGDASARLVGQRIEHLEAAIAAWKRLDRDTAEARLFPLSMFMVDVYAGALLVEQAAWEKRHDGRDRKALVARLYIASHLADLGPLRGVDASVAEDLTRFDELVAGALIDDRPAV